MDQLYKTAGVWMLYDGKHNTVRIDWAGSISSSEFKNAMYALLRQTHILRNCSVVLDFSKMKDISPRARVWFQDDFLKNEGQEMLNCVDYMAVVIPDNTLAQFITDNFKELCLNACSNLKYSEYGNFYKAIRWLKSSLESSSNNSKSILDYIPRMLRPGLL